MSEELMLATKDDLKNMYQRILPYLGGMPEMLANKFSKGDLYSTDEQIVGQWVDGKPIYQRTFEIQPFTANPDYTQVLISSGVVDKIIGQNGYYDYLWNGDIQVESIPSISGPPQNWAYWFVRVYKQNNGNLVFFYRNADGQARPITGGYVTVWYTKTTDSAIAIGSDTDYSTEEKIVGTWIDGSPLYQKTVAISNIGSYMDTSSDRTTSYNITNVLPTPSMCVNVQGLVRTVQGGVRFINVYNLDTDYEDTVPVMYASSIAVWSSGTIRLTVGNSLQPNIDKVYITFQYVKLS